MGGVWRELVWSDESEAHVAKHNVKPSEVEEVVNTRPQWQHPGVEGSTLVYGRTDVGRHLLVVLAESADGRWYVATARDLTPKEMRTFRRKAR
ncbi:MAG: BrnT family toxin [Acidimicrobiales bacterium]